MNFRVVLLFSLLAAGAPAPAANRFAGATQEQPNFLLLLSDDQTHRALGLLHELEVKTPHLDRLARRGMLFTHCFNQGGWSGAVCIPSRTMLNTGRHVWECRQTNGQDIADVPLWGETLGQAGYHTFMAGKWHIPDAALSRSFKTIGPLTGGFLPSTPETGEAYRRPAAGNNWSPEDPKWKGHWLDVEGTPVHSSVQIADAAIGYLKTHAATRVKPFFMYIAFNAPHDPRQAPGKFLDLYPPSTLKLPPNFQPKHPFLIESGFHGRDEILAPYPRTPEIIRVHLQEYYAIITHLDEQIGRILDTLETTGLAANTIVLFTSDQGLAVGQHGLLGKQNLYDHSLRMPFIIAGPGIPKGQRQDALVHMQSLFATTCDMAGVRVPDSVQFPSLVPLITGRKRQLNDALYAAFLDRQRAVRTEEWKLIRTPHAGQVQLFNVKRDPWELHNLAADPKHASTLAIMDAKLRTLMSEMKDPLPAAQLFATLTNAMPAETQRLPNAISKAASPNVVFVIADQWRAQAFGFAGDPNVKTPNFDRFERQSVHFTQAVAGLPVCSPTRASLLTGQRPHTHGVFINDVPLNPEAVTLPKVLKSAGYDTACIGKWHVDGHGSRSAFIPRERRQGFDYWKVLECTHAYSNSSYFADTPEKLKWEGYDAIAQTRDAQSYLREHARADKPFLLWLAWGPPHNPYESAPTRYRSLYPPEKIQLHPNVPESARAQARKELSGYYAHCTALDDCLAELLHTLDETGLATNTIVVFTSDHGDMLWSHDQQRKQRPWEESARVPLLFRLPASLGIQPHRLAATINTEDIMPTLLSLCATPIPKSVEGLDFTAAMRGGADPSGGSTIVRCISPFGEFIRKNGGREYRALRTAHNTYVRSLDGPWLLYDNEADPYQLNNLVGKPEHAELQSRLDSLLASKLAVQHDDFRPGPEYIAKWGYTVDADETAIYKP